MMDYKKMIKINNKILIVKQNKNKAKQKQTKMI